MGRVICPLGGAYRLISQVELDEVEWMDVALAACSPTVVRRVLDIGLRVRVSAVARENGAQTALQNTPGVFQPAHTDKFPLYTLHCDVCPHTKHPESHDPHGLKISQVIVC